MENRSQISEASFLNAIQYLPTISHPLWGLRWITNGRTRDNVQEDGAGAPQSNSRIMLSIRIPHLPP